MIGARWANAEGGRPINPAHAQGNEKMTVPLASKALKVGQRGIFHAKVVLSEGTSEEIAAPHREPRKPSIGLAPPFTEVVVDPLLIVDFFIGDC